MRNPGRGCDSGDRTSLRRKPSRARSETLFSSPSGSKIPPWRAVSRLRDIAPDPGWDDSTAALCPLRGPAHESNSMQFSTRLAVAMVALVFATAAAVGLLTYRDIAQRVLPGELYRMEVRARSLADLLADFVAGARSDIIMLRAVPANEGFIRAKRAGGIDPEDDHAARVRSEIHDCQRLFGHLRAAPALPCCGLVPGPAL